MRPVFSTIIVLAMTLYGGSFVHGEASGRAVSNRIPRLSADSHKIQDNRYFGRLTSADKRDVVEAAKIMFLIEAIKNSSYRFERNGRIHEAPEAAQHLMGKYTFMRNQIKTTKQFIDYLASGSSMTGKEYRVIVSEGETYPMRTVLYNELSYLDQVLER